METNDILGLGKVLPIKKLMDMMENSVGKITESYFARKSADAKAYEIKKIAEAKAEEIRIIAAAVSENFHLTGGIDYSEDKLVITSPKEITSATSQEDLSILPLGDRVQGRLHFQEAKRQFNIENVTAIAAEELKNAPPVTDEPVDEDWTTRFFRIAEDISNEEMQQIWGKILAGEIKQPKTKIAKTKCPIFRNIDANQMSYFRQ